MNHFAYFLIGFCIYCLTNKVDAATVYLPMPEGATLANGTDIHFRYPMSSDDYEQAYPKQASVPTSKGRLPVTVDHKMKPNLPRAGKAFTNLAKKLGPVATAVAAADFLCDLADVCINPDNPTVFQQRDPVAEPTPETPLETPFYYYKTEYDVPPVAKRWPSPSASCQQINTAFASHPNYSGTIYQSGFGLYGRCAFIQRSDGAVMPFGSTVSREAGCATGYYQDGLVCKRNLDPWTYQPMTDDKWDEAAPKLAVPPVVPHLVEAGEPVPVDTPLLEPKDVISEREEDIVRDGEGTATGTRQRTTTVKIEPLPNPSPTSLTSPAKVTETTVTTITNITNNTTNTTTTTYEGTPDEPPPEEEDTDIEFDEVGDEELDEHEMEQEFETQDWGGGSCPSDPVVSTSVGSFELPFHHACTFASTIRGVVLVLSSLTACFIVIGAKNGTD